MTSDAYTDYVNVKMYVTGDKERSFWTSNYVNLQRIQRFYPK